MIKSLFFLALKGVMNNKETVSLANSFNTHKKIVELFKIFYPCVFITLLRKTIHIICYEIYIYDI